MSKAISYERIQFSNSDRHKNYILEYFVWTNIIISNSLNKHVNG